MEYRRFFVYNISGALLWVAVFVIGGYCFGNVPAIKKNFSLTILGIIVVSMLPAVIRLMQHHRKGRALDGKGGSHPCAQERESSQVKCPEERAQ
jgi:membrane protein DedA with SNARE-associated domain